MVSHADGHDHLSSCTSASCVRCTKYSQSRHALPARWQSLRERSHCSDRLRASMEGILRTNAAAHRLSSNTPASTKLATVAAAAKVEDAAHSAMPTSDEFVLYVTCLPMTPWLGSDHHLVSIITAAGLTSDAILDGIRKEFCEAWNSTDCQWTFNSTGAVDRGWKTLPLVNQGVRNDGHTKLCKTTSAAVNGLGEEFLASCVFGNCSFSVLEPGAHILPHFGPCNVRVRCHIPLYAPDGPWLEVAGQRRYWHNTPLLLFNDAFRHEVKHEGVPEDGARVILMFDLWHPDLSADERNVIRALFPAE